MNFLKFNLSNYIYSIYKLTKKIFFFNSRQIKWILILSDKNYSKFLEINDRLRNKFKFVRVENNYYAKINNHFNDGNYGIIFDNDFKNKSFLKSFDKYDRKYFSILNLTNWSEYYLKRIPVEFISLNELNQIDKNSFFIKLQHLMKRFGDIIFSLILIFFLSPVMVMTSLFIYLEDKGPVFYSQIRSGYKGKKFRIYKFRSMKINSEKNGAQWASKSDSRITKVGKIIRLMRIDELPQLICVIKGTMSLIGPRPERPEIDDKLRESIKFYNYRYFLKPGLSGWAQVNYDYCSSLEDSTWKHSFDLYYLRNFSILLDFIIFFKTIKVVLFGID